MKTIIVKRGLAFSTHCTGNHLLKGGRYTHGSKACRVMVKIEEMDREGPTIITKKLQYSDKITPGAQTNAQISIQSNQHREAIIRANQSQE